MKQKLNNLLLRIQVHAEKPWYPLVLAFAGFICHFLLITPVDSLFIASVLLVPRRWVSLFLATTIGFSLGGLSAAALVHVYGTKIIERILPGILTSSIWTQSEHWMHQYGPLAVGGMSLVPLTLHPLIAVASLQNMPLWEITLSLFIGRFLKYGILGYVCAYLPTKLPMSILPKK